MERIRQDGAAGLSYHKMQRSALIASELEGYTAYLTRDELKRRVEKYQNIVDMQAIKELKGVRS